MIDALRKLFELLDGRERIQLGLLFVAMTVMALLQMVSIAAILPFLSVAADPTQIKQDERLAWAYELLRFSNTDDFLIALGLAALVVLIVSNSCMAATEWAKFRYVYGRNHAFSMKLMEHYLSQPYVWFLRRNSSELGKNILAEVEQVSREFMLPALQVASRTVVIVAIIGLLVVFDPILALSVTVVLGASFGAIWLGVRRKLTRQGSSRLVANKIRYRLASEAFGAIKEVKLRGLEAALLSRLRQPSARLNRAVSSSHIIGQVPRYGLEAIAFGGILVIALTLLVRGGALQDLLPVLGLYGFAGYRLMPMLQQLFQSVSKLRFGAPALDNLHHELMNEERRTLVAVPGGTELQWLPLEDLLELDRVTFTYPDAERPALSEVSLSIRANTTVGIVGPTGSGKTTLVDVILGLLVPESGEIRVDGEQLDAAHLRAWRAGLGYVPQHIWLSDTSIAANIAFGLPPADIDQEAVEHAARLAQIHDFVTTELPEGYETMVGERGIRLSGGQRQRIAIARALYHDPNILVFDEATSALDNETEAAVMDAVVRLSGTRTIIMVAHRLTTLENCDKTYLIESGNCLADRRPRSLVD